MNLLRDPHVGSPTFRFERCGGRILLHFTVFPDGGGMGEGVILNLGSEADVEEALRSFVLPRGAKIIVGHLRSLAEYSRELTRFCDRGSKARRKWEARARSCDEASAFLASVDGRRMAETSTQIEGSGRSPTSAVPAQQGDAQ